MIPGVSYQGTVLFESLVAVDNSSFDAAGGTSSYVTRTKFAMVTAPPDVKLYYVLKSQAFENTKNDSERRETMNTGSGLNS